MPIRCYECKAIDIINDVSKTCQNCFEIRSSYGFSHDNIPLRCKTCKTTDMINVHNKICEYPTCTNSPTCEYPDSTATLII